MQSLTLIIFGITSNLAQIKLIPALYDLEEKGCLPKNTTVIGVARQPRTVKEFKDYTKSVLTSENIHHQHPIKETVLSSLCHRLHYLDGLLEDPAFFAKLKNYLDKLNLRRSNYLFYLATYPKLYEQVFSNLQLGGFNQHSKGWLRLMVEKPIGHDLTSAIALNKLLLKYFTEDQIFRLDHYLGKETMQNILTFRFGNGLFEPLINAGYVDHIQIQALEDYGVGRRGNYYDNVGALKDVGQNHLLQMLALSCMDAPAEFSNEAVTKQRIKILKDLIPNPKKIVFGQYQGYQQEENVAPNSQTDTYFALQLKINNDRFQGVPIYIRAGKKLTRTVTEIAIVFKNPVNRLFSHLQCGEEPNVLIYRIQPNEGVVVKILTKRPGFENNLNPEFLQFCYKADPHSHNFPDPYERLLLDAINGNQTFFNDAEEVEAQWAFTDALAKTTSKPYLYKPGSWGPKEADRLIEADGRCWLEPSMDFCRI